MLELLKEFNRENAILVVEAIGFFVCGFLRLKYEAIHTNRDSEKIPVAAFFVLILLSAGATKFFLPSIVNNGTYLAAALIKIVILDIGRMIIIYAHLKDWRYEKEHLEHAPVGLEDETYQMENYGYNAKAYDLLGIFGNLPAFVSAVVTAIMLAARLLAGN